MNEHIKGLDEFNRLGELQDATLQDYKLSMGLTKDEAGKLHMFFSPWRIPTGLTDTEVRICITLHPLRQSMVDKKIGICKPSGLNDENSVKEFMEHVRRIYHCEAYALPEKLSPREPMTRSRFRKGIHQFLKEALAT